MDTQSKPMYEVRPARLLTAASVIWINAFGLLLGLFVLAAIAWISFQPLTAFTYIVPLLAIVAATLCLPIGFGNPYVRRLAARIKRGMPSPGDRIVQLAMRPRLRSGIRATLEDADDIGWLSVMESEIVYEGDAVTMRLPLHTIERAELRNVGFRGLFIYGPRLVLTVSGIEGADGFEVADRSSFFLPQSRSTVVSLYREVLSKAGLNPETGSKES